MSMKSGYERKIRGRSKKGAGSRGEELPEPMVISSLSDRRALALLRRKTDKAELQRDWLLRSLRKYFDEKMAEPVPDQFRKLLDELARRDENKPAKKKK